MPLNGTSEWQGTAKYQAALVRAQQLGYPDVMTAIQTMRDAGKFWRQIGSELGYGRSQVKEIWCKVLAGEPEYGSTPQTNYCVRVVSECEQCGLLAVCRKRVLAHGAALCEGT